MKRTCNLDNQTLSQYACNDRDPDVRGLRPCYPSVDGRQDIPSKDPADLGDSRPRYCIRQEGTETAADRFGPRPERVQSGIFRLGPCLALTRQTQLDKYIGEVFNAFTSSGTPKTTPTSTVKTIPKPKSEPREPQIDAPSSAPATKKRKIKSEAKVENVSDLEDADERYARELQAALNQTRSSRSGGAKAAKKVKRKRKMETIINSDGETVEVEAKKKKRAPTNNGFNKLLTLTAELSDLVGHKYLSRPQVVSPRHLPRHCIFETCS